MAVTCLLHGIVAVENRIGTRRNVMIQVKQREFLGVSLDEYSLCLPQALIVVVLECQEHASITDHLQRNAVSGTIGCEQGGEQIFHTFF